MHADQLDIPAATVRALVDAQFPQWRDLPLRELDTQGTVNAIFRLGDSYTLRFPLQPRPGAREWLVREAAAARELLGRTPFATPEPIALGEPGPGYPLPWSVQTWLPGVVVTDQSLGDDFALDLAAFMSAVRSLPTHGRTFTGGGRGGELTSQDEWMEICLERHDPSLRPLWHELRELPRGDTPDAMTHGDLIPGNVLLTAEGRRPGTAQARLSGILDVGGLSATDPALELVGAWHLLEPGPRRTLREALGPSDLEWQRGKAWAFAQAMGLPWYYAETNPAMARTGLRTLARIVQDS
ncbi:putative phosphotransferase [Paractinoplanes abujensis]|uniref:Aminoglycoside phosphotransferase (APT) family kinase protein n=1 Tax=Paractinoplanes abujensis TaxID=882441 RepID=A0A7W7CNW5_9ACTN|nr:phosphotransferase [Actinoplanes abujensis]MBB4692007.1 aminoglycoside phosphotransferase (APT) family kinase protein [Actinoplanes abujensis]GID16576.1 putative phosphotransferase [Actinoplanes abujensis]